MRDKRLTCPDCRSHTGIRRTLVRYRDGLGCMTTICECENGHRWLPKERRRCL